jgi:hypothetical protein
MLSSAAIAPITNEREPGAEEDPLRRTGDESVGDSCTGEAPPAKQSSAALELAAGTSLA